MALDDASRILRESSSEKREGERKLPRVEKMVIGRRVGEWKRREDDVDVVDEDFWAEKLLEKGTLVGISRR